MYPVDAAGEIQISFRSFDNSEVTALIMKITEASEWAAGQWLRGREITIDDVKLVTTGDHREIVTRVTAIRT